MTENGIRQWLSHTLKRFDEKISWSAPRERFAVDKARIRTLEGLSHDLRYVADEFDRRRSLLKQ